MSVPTYDQRAALDNAMQALAALGDNLTIDDFRIARQLRTRRTAQLVRWFIGTSSLVFMALALATIFVQGTNTMFSAAVWALALGGLGALSSIFINVLNLIPLQTLRTSDLFEAIGRTILGCIFGTILATTIIASDATTYFSKLGRNEISNSSALLLLPFLAGFSITFVLNLFDKIIHSIELGLGIDDRSNARKKMM
jgi:hypothetical protein